MASSKDGKGKGKSRNKGKDKLKRAKAASEKAGWDVIRTRQAIKKLDKSPKGHFSKDVIGSPSDVRKKMSSGLRKNIKKRDSLRGVYRKLKRK